MSWRIIGTEGKKVEKSPIYFDRQRAVKDMILLCSKFPKVKFKLEVIE